MPTLQVASNKRVEERIGNNESTVTLSTNKLLYNSLKRYCTLGVTLFNKWRCQTPNIKNELHW